MTTIDQVDIAADRFQHEAFLYRDDAQFVDHIVGFVRAGLESDEDVAVVEPPERIDQLRDALGADANDVRFLDMTEIGINPSRIIAVWQTFVAQQVAAGRGLRGVGEPAWPGRRMAEMDECGLHELLLNRAFENGPHWRLLCPYDVTNLAPDVLDRALRTHPIQSDADGLTRCDGYADEAILDAFQAPLPPAAQTAQQVMFGTATLGALRASVAEFARAHHVPADRIDDLVIASSEIAANSARYGGGAGEMLLWAEPDAVVVQVNDRGQIHEPLVGRSVPPLDALGGRGLYLANQLCDLVQLRSSAFGTTVRITTWL